MEGLERGREITNGNLGAIMRAGCVLMMLIGALVLAAPAGAVTYTVTTTSDAVANDAQCSLREAIQEANNGADTDCAGSPSNGNDTIVFSVSGTITLSSTLPNILDAATVGALTIDGSGQSITISGGGSVRVMVVDVGANLTLQNLTIANGYAPVGSGGGISNAGTLNVTNSIFSGNGADSGGGGIYNSGGTVTLSNSTFSGNNATTGGGGVLNNGGTLNVTNSTFSANIAGWDGGGIDNISWGTVNVTNSTFSGNSATTSGGGIYNSSGTLNVTNSTFSGNSASSEGGGIWNADTLTVTNSTFSRNSAPEGGGIANTSTLTVTTSTFDTNTAGINGGAVFNNGGTLNMTNSIVFNNSAANGGGGIYNLMDGTVRVTGSTFSANSAANGAGILNADGSLYVTNSTFAGNTATNYGGGIRSDSWLNVTNSTLSNNAATSAGGIYVTAGSWATIRNTIIANSTAGGDCVGTLSGSNINNLIEDSTNACGLFNGVDGNIIGVDPNLGPLTGSPAYYPLVFPSAAIDAGDPTTCSNAPVSNQSQNGVTRPQDGNGDTVPICDIGSFEAPAAPAAQSDMAASLGSLPPSLSPGGSYTSLSFSCTNNGPDPATNATCSITASAGTVSGVSCNPPVPVGSLANGAIINCTFNFTAPGISGGGDTPQTGVTFTVTAGASNDSNAANNTAGNTTPVPLVDALDDSTSFPASFVGATFNVGSNDQFGSGSLPPGASFTLLGATTCASASINSSGVATFNVPASGTCVVAYRVCVISGCDNAQLVVTAQQQQQPIPTLDEWGLTALVLLMVGAGLLLVRRLIA